MTKIWLAPMQNQAPCFVANGEYLLLLIYSLECEESA